MDPVLEASGEELRGYAVTLRAGPRVERERFGDLASAMTRLERAVELTASERRAGIDLGYRRFDPIQQGAARIELRGPGRLRGGIDVRGDGSTEAYTGGWRRRLVEQRPGESPAAALRRALGT